MNRGDVDSLYAEKMTRSMHSLWRALIFRWFPQPRNGFLGKFVCPCPEALGAASQQQHQLAQRPGRLSNEARRPEMSGGSFYTSWRSLYR